MDIKYDNLDFVKIPIDEMNTKLKNMNEAFYRIEGLHNLPGQGFWSHPYCFSCGYDLKRNHPDDWQQKTSCPECDRSFVD